MSSTHTLSVNIFNLERGETKLARDKKNFHAPGENRTRDPASFCQQVDDWIDYDRPSNNCDKLVPSIWAFSSLNIKLIATELSSTPFK